MQTSELFRIIEYKNPTAGTVSYRVTGMLDGKQIRKNRSTMTEAMTLKQDFERRALNMAPLPAVTTRLTNDQAAEAEACFRSLIGKPYTMTQAMDFALRNWSETRKPVTVSAAFVLFIKSKEQANLRAASITNLKARLSKLVKTHGTHQLAELQPEAIKPLIFRENSGLVNQDSDYRVFTNFFNWSVAQEYRERSPMDLIPPITVEDREPVIMPLDRVRLLLNAAHVYKDGICEPFTVLSLFCAIRPDREMSRLTWKHINLEEKIIRLSADVAKMRGRRLVEISDNAVALLRPHFDKQTPLKHPNWTKDFRAVKRLAGYGSPDREHRDFDRFPKDQAKPICYCADCLKQRGQVLEEWTPDILRHTAITHHLAKHSEDITAKWAGNSPDIIHSTYKGLLESAKDTDAFWKLLPAGGAPDNILPMLQAANP